MKTEVGRYEVEFPSMQVVDITPLSNRCRFKGGAFFFEEPRDAMPKYLQHYLEMRWRHVGYIYLIHFERKLADHAQHYLGFAKNVSVREILHRKGNGAAILRACNEQGIGYEVVRLWTGDRYFERELKRQKAGPTLCPICNPGNHRKEISTGKKIQPIYNEPRREVWYEDERY